MTRTPTKFHHRWHWLVLVILAWVGLWQLSTVNNLAYAWPQQGPVTEYLNARGRLRSYILYTPSTYDPARPTPVIIALHGSTASGKTLMDYTHLNDLAEKQGILLVYPNKAAPFDWDHRSGLASKDATYIRDVITQIKSERNVDPSRIYVTGYSSGGFMTHLLACTMSDEVAAFAPVDGVMPKNVVDHCLPSQPVSMLFLNGTRDPAVNWRGSHKFLSVPDTVAFWAQHDHCTGWGEPQTAPKQDPADPTRAVDTEATGCTTGSEIEQVVIQGGGHTWPGSQPSPRIRLFLGRTNTDINANDLMWAFFSRHTLPQPTSEADTPR